MHRLTLAVLLLSSPVLAAPPAAAPAAPAGKAAEPAKKPNDKFKSDEERTLYALGLVLGSRIQSFGLSPAELDVVKMGITDSATGAEPKVELQTWGPKIDELAQKRATATADKEKANAKPFLEKMSKEKGAQKLPNGMVIIPEKEGTGPSPKATDTVKVNYEGKLTNGTVFDSSYKRNEPATFPLNQVIPCWTEGLQKMKVGGKAKLVCPSDVAYGDRGHPPTIPGGATLVFTVELLSIEAPPAGQPGMPGMPGGAPGGKK